MLFAASDFVVAKISSRLCRQMSAHLAAKPRRDYLFNSLLDSLFNPTTNPLQSAKNNSDTIPTTITEKKSKRGKFHMNAASSTQNGKLELPSQDDRIPNLICPCSHIPVRSRPPFPR
jgi:hypothetical protein